MSIADSNSASKPSIHALKYSKYFLVDTCLLEFVPQVLVAYRLSVAWYPLFAHARNLPEILVNRELSCSIRI